MTLARVATAIVCALALAAGVATLVGVHRHDMRPHTTDLTSYADAVCTGLAAPASAYRSMVTATPPKTNEKNPNAKNSGAKLDPNVGLKAWYVAYFDTMAGTVTQTLSTLERTGPVDDEVAATDATLRSFFVQARVVTTERQRVVRALDPHAPGFDGRIDALTGGPIAPERFDAMLRRAQATPGLDAAMARATSCGPARDDMRLVMQGKMLDLLFNGTRPV